MIAKLQNFPSNETKWNVNLFAEDSGVPFFLGYGFHPTPGQLFFTSVVPEAGVEAVGKTTSIRLGPSPGPVYTQLSVRECELDSEGCVHCLMDVAP